MQKKGAFIDPVAVEAYEIQTSFESMSLGDSIVVLAFNEQEGWPFAVRSRHGFLPMS